MIRRTSANAGSTIIEALIALMMLVAASYYALTGVGQQMKAMTSASGASVHAEWDQVVHYELGRILQRLQMRLADATHPDLGLNPCTTGPVYFKEVADLSRESPNLYFGTWASAIATFPSYEARYAKVESDLQGNSSPEATRLKQAINRCQLATTAGQTLHTPNWTGYSSFYICGFGNDALVEVKFSFWDFTASAPLNCQSMNANIGRGVQAMYRVQAFHKDGTPDVFAPKPKYTLKQTTGRLYVPKNLRGN